MLFGHVPTMRPTAAGRIGRTPHLRLPACASPSPRSRSPRCWRWPRTTRSASRRAPSCERRCSASTSRRPPVPTQPSGPRRGGRRRCGSSAAPATPTRWPSCSATRSSCGPTPSRPTAPTRPRSLRLMVGHAGPGQSGVGRVRSVLVVVAGGRKAAELNFRTACEVADLFAKRLGLDEAVRAALAATFERWNGRGLPDGVEGHGHPAADADRPTQPGARGPRPRRGHRPGPGDRRARRGKAYDPALVDLVLAEAAGGGTASSRPTPGTRRSPSAPPSAPLDDAAVHESLLVLADFADLKSPWTSGHSRASRPWPWRRAGRSPRRPRWCTTSAASPSPTPSGTSPARSPATSGIGPRRHALVTDQLLRRVPVHGHAGRGRRARPTSGSTGRATTGGSTEPISTRPSECSPPPTAIRP